MNTNTPLGQLAIFSAKIAIALVGAAIFGQSIAREVMDEVAKAWTKTVASRHTRRFWRAWAMKATSH
jgi:hypothetical protein